MRYLILIPFLFTILQSTAQIVQNDGQWVGDFLAKYSNKGLEVYLIEDGFVLQNIYIPNEDDSTYNRAFKPYYLRIAFEGAQIKSENFVAEYTPYTYNYFNENVPQGITVRPFSELLVKDIYPNIDLQMSTHNDQFKYSLILNSGCNPSNLIIQYTSSDSIVCDQGQLRVGFGESRIVESEFVGWEVGNENNKFQISRNHLGNQKYKLDLSGFDLDNTIIIDPYLYYSTIIGGTNDSWGVSATGDNQGNMYVGGVAWIGNFPVTGSAYDVSFNGGNDIVISKLDPTGANLLFSTYIGGSSSDVPIDLMVHNNNLYLLGTSSSDDFPITSGTFSYQFQGGSSCIVDGIDFFNGADLVVCKFSLNGAQLKKSTYLSAPYNRNEGLNCQLNTTAPKFTGKMIIINDDLLISSTEGTTSSFAQRALLFRIDTTLNDLYQTIYIEGNGHTACQDMAMTSNNKLFLVGVTNCLSNSLDGATNSLFGGLDGFISKFSYSASAGLTYTTSSNSRYIGDVNNNQICYIDATSTNKLVLIGTSSGAYMDAFGTAYSIPNSNQFIECYDQNMVKIWGTSIGNGTGQLNFRPTALDVDSEDKINFAGVGNSMFLGMDVTGLPIALNSIEDSATTIGTESGGYYLAQLDTNAAALLWATYFNAQTSDLSDHVHGRAFIRDGSFYHPVCAGCAANSDGFYTTEVAYSHLNISTNCSVGAFKIGPCIVPPTPLIADSKVYICSGTTADLQVDTSITGTNYNWQWFEGSCTGNFIGSGYSLQVSPNANTIYYVREIGSCGNSGSCSSIEVVVSSLNVTLSETPIILGADGAIDITVSGNLPPYDFNWIGPLGFVSTYEDINGLNEGLYQVTITDSIGCAITSALDLGSQLGLDDEQINITIYPNPTTGEFIIELYGNSSELTIVIRNSLGQIVEQLNSSDDRTIIDFANQSDGIYQVEITAPTFHILRSVVLY